MKQRRKQVEEKQSSYRSCFGIHYFCPSILDSVSELVNFLISKWHTRRCLENKIKTDSNAILSINKNNASESSDSIYFLIVAKIGATSRFCQSVANNRGKVDLVANFIFENVLWEKLQILRCCKVRLWKSLTENKVVYS